MNPKVLIVEDNEVISEQLNFFLKRYEYICSTYDTGEEALEKVREFAPDIVLMDIKLAGLLDGIETARRMKEIDNYPILFLTSHIEPTIIEKAASIDPAGFVSKSISHSELKVQIDYVLIKHAKLRDQENKMLKLETSTQKYDAIFNSSRDAIFFIDSNMIVSYWNNSAERIFGFTTDEAIGKSLSDMILPIDTKSTFILDYNNWIGAIVPDSLHKTMNIKLQNKKNRVFPSELTLGIVDFNNEKSVCGFARDITEKVLAEEEISKLIEEMQITKEIVEQNASEVVILNAKLYESEDMLQELNASKDKFFSIIAHDLKGPFQGLLGYSSILTSDLNDMTMEEISELGHNLNQSANHLFKLLENLLHWSRIQRGVIDCNPIDFELLLLATQNIDLIDARAKQKDIKLINNVPEALYVFADVNMLNTILRNLLSNAIKFTPKGGEIELSAKLITPDKIKIEVKDTGVGMTEEAIRNAFRIDSYNSTPGTDNEQGTGLGLILCKDLVEKNNGTIVATSKVGFGTTFSFVLPIGSSSSYQD